jgi:hypothetical protein
MLGNVIYLYYNAFFCGSLAYSIHKTLTKPLFSVPKQHLMCLFVMVIALLVIIFTSEGYPFTTLCIYRLANLSSLGLFVLHLIIALFTFYVLRKFKGKIPQNSFFENQSHFKYYYLYMVFFCGFEVVNTVLILAGFLTCATGSSSSDTVLEVLYSISNCMTILLAYASVALRLGHPFIFNKLKNIRHYRSISAEEHSHQVD